MSVLFIYFIKIIICSSILLGYYLLALKNKIYHGYNRFYLLASIVISLIVPFMEFHFTHYSNEAASDTIKVLQVVSSGNEYLDEIIVTAKTSQLSVTQLVGLTYILISLVFILLLIKGLLRIRKLYKENQRKKFDSICIIDTTAKDTPFSFFNYIFWNSYIDMASDTGKQVFKHEMVHVKEKHSLDKIFINLVLAVLWCNPFFWITRRELNMIHEFIADKKSLEDGDAEAFALMILQTSYPQQNFSLTNQYFYSPIKRRLAMITKNKHSKAGYIARLLALPLFLFIVSAFTIKTKIFKPEVLSFYDGDAVTVVIDAGHGGNDLGAISKNKKDYEKDITLAIAKKVKELNKNGKINIILSRTDDIYSSPHETVTFTKEKKADCFISIHVNGKDATANYNSGLVVLVAKDQYPISEKSKVLASAMIKEFSGKYHLPVIPNPVQKEKGVWVLQANECPSVLIEAGFIDNKKDLAYLQSEEGKKSIAMNILKAIENYAANRSEQNVFNQSDTLPASINFKVNKLVIENNGSTTSTAEGNVSIAGVKKMLVVIDGKKIDNSALKNVIITAKSARIYGENNKDAIKQFGEEASNGTMVLKGVHIEKNNSNKKETILKVEEATLVEINERSTGIQRPEITDASEKNPATKKNEWGKTVVLKETALPGKTLNGTVTIKTSNLDTSGNDSIKPRPLYIVDGIEKGQNALKEIAPESIEKIDVLKNENATSKYGQKAKDGVVIITTKKAESLKLSKDNSNGVQFDVKLDPIFTEVENEASFPGGLNGWKEYLIKNLDGTIPQKEGWKKGKYYVTIQFIVDKDGNINNVKALNYETSQTALHCINLIKNGPKWNPAVQNGHSVNSFKKQPITFVVE